MEFLHDGWFLTDEDSGEGWWSVPACLLVAVKSDSWCADLTAFWTGEGWAENNWDAAHTSCVFPSRIHVSLPLPYASFPHWWVQLSWSEDSCVFPSWIHVSLPLPYASFPHWWVQLSWSEDSCVFPLWIHVSLPLLYASFSHWWVQLSWSEDSCRHDWWLIPACARCLFSWFL